MELSPAGLGPEAVRVHRHALAVVQGLPVRGVFGSAGDDIHPLLTHTHASKNLHVPQILILPVVPCGVVGAVARVLVERLGRAGVRRPAGHRDVGHEVRIPAPGHQVLRDGFAGLLRIRPRLAQGRLRREEQRHDAQAHPRPEVRDRVHVDQILEAHALHVEGLIAGGREVGSVHHVVPEGLLHRMDLVREVVHVAAGTVGQQDQHRRRQLHAGPHLVDLVFDVRLDDARGAFHLLLHVLHSVHQPAARLLRLGVEQLLRVAVQVGRRVHIDGHEVLKV
mmetsp:Transcript_103260/g.266966  ORF Transcript_103260/g.266966 Transcript_103260/m.266966 type:complete len:279 (+) Transcript_103260:1808-2644(+)